MILNHTPFALPICLSLVLALNLPPVPNLNLTSPTTLVSPIKTSLTADPIYSCKGGLEYGDRIPLASCHDAANDILSSLPYSYREPISFGDRRGPGGRSVLVPLPYISISADGGCALEIISSDAARSDLATILQFTNWSLDMIDECKVDEDAVKGGKARLLGTYGLLGLRLTKFSSGNIACQGSSQPDATDCEKLLNQMPATDLWRGFGKSGDAGVDVKLPFLITAPGLMCAIIVHTRGRPDHEKWYTIWKNVAAVVKLCVSDRQKGGTAFRMGLEDKSIYVEVTDGR